MGRITVHVDGRPYAAMRELLRITRPLQVVV
jgi:hypothetical protein